MTITTTAFEVKKYYTIKTALRTQDIEKPIKKSTRFSITQLLYNVTFVRTRCQSYKKKFSPKNDYIRPKFLDGV